MKNNQSHRAAIWSLMSPVMGQIHKAMALSAIGMVLGFLSLYCLLLAILAVDGNDSPWRWLGASALCILSGFSCRTFAFGKSHLAAFRLEHLLRTRLCDHLARVSMGFLINSGSGALAKVVQEDVKNLHVFVADTTPILSRAGVAPLVSLATLLWINWQLALVTLAVLACGVAALMLAFRGGSDNQREYDEANELINQRVIEFVQAMPVVRTFDTGTDSFSRYHASLEHFRRLMIKWLALSSEGGRISAIFLTPLTTLLALSAVGFVLLAQGSIAIDSWVAYLLMGTTLVESILPLMWLQLMIRKARGSADRIRQMLQVPALPVPLSSCQPQDASVSFDKVSFCYDGRETPALDNVSFRVAPGTVTALVGRSGSGKSTVARLIPRFWDVAEGRVSVGGVDVRRLQSEDLMAQVAFVFQDNFLFSGTIAENIALGCEGASRVDIERAATAALADGFIRQLPRGYDTHVGERGGSLSGGQRQSLTIARAILQDRPILVLDEATAFFDPDNEVRLLTAMANLMRGKTVIVIAHRLTTIADADQILVFDQGVIVERGTHEQLMHRQGRYAGLWQNHQQAQDWHLGRDTLSLKEDLA